MSPPLPTDKGRFIRLEAKAEFVETAGQVPADVLSVNSMLVSDSGESAHRIEALLRGEEQSFARSTLLYNASLAAWTADAGSSREEAGAKCDEALDSGAAFAVLEKWRRFSERNR